MLVDLTSDSEDELPLKRKTPAPKATPPITDSKEENYNASNGKNQFLLGFYLDFVSPFKPLTKIALESVDSLTVPQTRQTYNTALFSPGVKKA